MKALYTFTRPTPIMIHLKLTRLALTTERSYQTDSHNIHVNITRLVRRFLLRRRNMSSNRIHCCYIIINTELKEMVKVKVKSLSRVRLFTTQWSIALQAPLSLGFSRQEYWSGVPDGGYKSAGLRSLMAKWGAIPASWKDLYKWSPCTNITQSSLLSM